MAPKLLNILLQRNDSNVQWGFRLSGGKDLAKPLTIVKVFPRTLAAQYMTPGDTVLSIQGYPAKDLLYVEAVELVRDPGKSLELVVQKTDNPLSDSNENLPASIWGPEPVLQRPSEWLRRSPSPFPTQYFQPISPNPSTFHGSLSSGNGYSDSSYGYSDSSSASSPVSPILQRPSDWLRRSPTPFATVRPQSTPASPVSQIPRPWMGRPPSPPCNLYSETKSTEYKSANSLRQHFESVSQNTHQETNFRTGYTPTAMDSKKREKFEFMGSESGFGNTKKSAFVPQETSLPIYYGSSNAEKNHLLIGNDDNNTYQDIYKPQANATFSYMSKSQRHEFYKEEKSQYQTTKEVHTEQDSNAFQISSADQLPEYNTFSKRETELKRDNSYERKEDEGNHKREQYLKIPKQEIEVKTQGQFNMSSSGSQYEKQNISVTVKGNNLQHITEKPIIQSTADIMKRPISPEFNAFPYTKGNSLLKIVLSKSLGNYSPADFEKMKASAIESDTDDDDDLDLDSSTEEEEEDDEDEDTEEEQEYSIANTTQDEDACSSCYQPSLADSGSVIFERYWAFENEENYNAEEPELVQGSPSSLYNPQSRASSSASLSSRPGTPMVNEQGSRDSSVSRNNSSLSVSSRPGTPTVLRETGATYRSLSRASSTSSICSRPDTPIGSVSSRPGTPIAGYNSRDTYNRSPVPFRSATRTGSTESGSGYVPLSRNSSTSSVHSRPETPTNFQEERASSVSPCRIFPRAVTPTNFQNAGTSYNSITMKENIQRLETLSLMENSEG